MGARWTGSFDWRFKRVTGHRLSLRRRDELVMEWTPARRATCSPLLLGAIKKPAAQHSTNIFVLC
jgi:hypothetical protein